jgi:hypothetical protein
MKKACLFLIFSLLAPLALHAKLVKKTAYVSTQKRVTFLTESKGNAYCVGEGCSCNINFSYAVENDQVKVTKIDKIIEGNLDYCPVMLLTQPCKIQVNEAEKIYSYELACGHDVYINEAAVLAKDTPTEINAVPVIYLGDTSGHTTTVVKFRATPDAAAQAGKCYFDAGLPAETLPKHKNLKLVARTLQKVKVGNWENYWYFVKTGDSCAFGEDMKYLPYGGVWVYGELIKPGKK